MTGTALPTELIVFALSVLLLIVHVMAQGQSATRDFGTEYNLGPRDEQKPQSVMTGRLDRAKWNFLETYPAFVGLAVALVITGQAGQWGAWGAVLWLVARVVYLPLYALGIPVVRTLAWGVALIGLLVMLGSLLF